MEAGDIVMKADLAREERFRLLARLDAHAVAATGGLFHEPGIEIDAAVATDGGDIVGGVNASTKLGVMFLEVLWVDDAHRERDLGSLVVREAERLAREAGCRASQTWTFSFQAPRFYEKLGYRQIGFFDGYPDGITEHVLVKRLDGPPAPLPEAPVGYRLLTGATGDVMAPVRSGFHDFCVAAVGDAMNGIVIDLALRDSGGRLVGGLHAWTTLQVVVPECIWVDAGYRRQGLGARLMGEAERIAREHGCISSQTGALSFQSPGFFEALGYAAYGESDAYPSPYTETYFIKPLAPPGP